MKITVLRKMKYNDVFIYVMQFSDVFQYLFAWNGEIFQNHIVMTPDWKRRLLSKLGRSFYTKEQLEEGEKVILSGAIKTIDKLLLKYPISGSRREKVFQREKASNAKKKCLWQAREGDGDDKYWVCLTHGEIVKMKDGVKPSHK